MLCLASSVSNYLKSSANISVDSYEDAIEKVGCSSELKTYIQLLTVVSICIQYSRVESAKKKISVGSGWVKCAIII